MHATGKETRMDNTRPTPDRIMRRAEVLARLGIGQSTLYQWMAEGTFPRPVALGSKLVGWPESAVTGWIDGRRNRDGKTVAQLRQEAAAGLAGAA
jgi:prophage regulatory protein